MNKRMQKKAAGRPMLRTFRKEGTYYSSATGAMYLSKTPTRFRRLPVADPKTGAPALDDKGEIVMADFPVSVPWQRVTPKPSRPGAARREELQDFRGDLGRV